MLMVSISIPSGDFLLLKSCLNATLINHENYAAMLVAVFPPKPNNELNALQDVVAAARFGDRRMGD